MGYFERKFYGKGVVHQRILASENESLCAIMWCCLRDPTLSRFDTIPACDTQTHTQTHDDGYYLRRVIIATYGCFVSLHECIDAVL